MKTLHLLTLPMVLSAAFAAAQTAPAVTSKNTEAVTHFDPRHPCALPTICDSFGAASKQPLLPFTLKPVQSAPLPRATILVASNLFPKTCYTVRAYEYSEPDPESGHVRRTGATTCQPSSSFHMKYATMAKQP